MTTMTEASPISYIDARLLSDAEHIGLAAATPQKGALQFEQ